MGPHICIGVDVDVKTHRVGIAGLDGMIVEEFTIAHSQEGFQEFFTRIEQ